MSKNSRGILMSENMMTAYMRGLKTQTRRLKGLDEINQVPDEWEPLETVNSNQNYYYFQHLVTRETIVLAPPYGRVGDHLYFKETWATAPELDGIRPSELPEGTTVFFREDHSIDPRGLKWRSPLFLPRRLARADVEILDIRVERLRSITAADAIAEGIDRVNWDETHTEYLVYEQKRHSARDVTFTQSPTRSYKTLWETLHGQGSFDLNPWVFVYTFPKKGSHETT